eukprot:TRINITY_DN18577_c0_g3_i1.p1 TRINITY_DN18577_c0_g3~~TRINITY_DN18577_c0_g3_i1.p1  ORF type:complete len:584 (-),score=95.55 TRINITY_DN18577_c0_g3_i1:475-2226(-)
MCIRDSINAEYGEDRPTSMGCRSSRAATQKKQDTGFRIRIEDQGTESEGSPSSRRDPCPSPHPSPGPSPNPSGEGQNSRQGPATASAPRRGATVESLTPRRGRRRRVKGEVKVACKRRAAFEALVRTIHELNPGSCVRKMLEGAVMASNGELVAWNLQQCHLQRLPEEFGRLRVQTHLTLSWNMLESLPTDFGSLIVGASLDLGGNRLTALPPSFGRITVEGDLDLYNNKLSTLPDSFGTEMRIGGNLYLHDNLLGELPKKFGNDLKIGGDLVLSGNQLRSLPSNFGHCQIGGHLVLTENQLSALPETFGQGGIGGSIDLDTNHLESLPCSFGDLDVRGHLDLCKNKLVSLPKSFGRITVGGLLSLSSNLLSSLPISFKNIRVNGDVSIAGNSLSHLPPTLPNCTGMLTLVDTFDFSRASELYLSSTSDDSSDCSITKSPGRTTASSQPTSRSIRSVPASPSSCSRYDPHPHPHLHPHPDDITEDQPPVSPYRTGRFLTLLSPARLRRRNTPMHTWRNASCLQGRSNIIDEAGVADAIFGAVASMAHSVTKASMSGGARTPMSARVASVEIDPRPVESRATQM